MRDRPFLRRVLTLLGALTVAAPAALAQQGDGTAVAIEAHVFKPAKVAVDFARLEQLRLPPGFAIRPFATGLKNPRILAVAPDGTIYVSRREQGDVLMLKDADGDGRADRRPVAVAHRPGAHGLAVHDGRLYLATVKELFVADIQDDGRLGPLQILLNDLPDAGQHANRTLAFGPDGMLYLSVGSTCNACNESNPENATLLRLSPDGSQRSIFASGLRNTIGFGWHPLTGELWGMDHGIDFLGDDVQPEELNRIERGKQYGWPHVWGSGGINPQSTPPGGITKAQWKEHSVPMALGYAAHAAPMQLVFYPGGSFPAQYTGDAFVTMRGSWNRSDASGYEIVRVRFGSDGQPKAFEPFVSGFLTDGGRTHIARPVGLAVARDGALLMADDANGVIYRIAPEPGQEAQGGAPETEAPASVSASAAAAGTAAPSGPMQQQAAQGSGVPLVNQRDETRTAGRVSVGSTVLRAGQAIPVRYSEYADGVSPPIEWAAVPDAVSYAVIVEDPDAKPTRPFVHWLAWNIPASTVRLPEGLQEQPRLTEPEGLLQGRNSRGSMGWFGPRPPVGDPPHRYHFQVLALNRMLEVPPGADRDQLLAATAGHVLAKGELVAHFQQAEPPLKDPAAMSAPPAAGATTAAGDAPLTPLPSPPR